MRVEKFLPGDIAKLEDHSWQKSLIPLMNMDQLDDLTRTGAHISVFDGDILIGCGGVVEINDWRGGVWSLLRDGRPQNFLGLHRASVRLLQSLPYKRIEGYVDPTIPEAVRWIRLLGFRLEMPYKPYFFPDGRGAAEWAFYN